MNSFVFVCGPLASARPAKSFIASAAVFTASPNVALHHYMVRRSKCNPQVLIFLVIPRQSSEKLRSSGQ